MALNSGIQTYQILTNDDEVCIFLAVLRGQILELPFEILFKKETKKVSLYCVFSVYHRCTFATYWVMQTIPTPPLIWVSKKRSQIHGSTKIHTRMKLHMTLTTKSRLKCNTVLQPRLLFLPPLEHYGRNFLILSKYYEAFVSSK